MVKGSARSRITIGPRMMGPKCRLALGVGVGGKRRFKFAMGMHGAGGFLSLPNLKSSAFSSFAYRLIEYGPLGPASTFFNRRGLSLDKRTVRKAVDERIKAADAGSGTIERQNRKKEAEGEWRRRRSKRRTKDLHSSMPLTSAPGRVICSIIPSLHSSVFSLIVPAMERSMIRCVGCELGAMRALSSPARIEDKWLRIDHRGWRTKSTQ